MVRRHQQGPASTRRPRRSALDAVKNGRHPVLPEHWSQTYNHWLEHPGLVHFTAALVGHQIPAWYDADGEVYVARSEADALKQSGGKPLTRDPDVLDTWFSSALVCHHARLADSALWRRTACICRQCARHRQRHHLLLGRPPAGDDDAAPFTDKVPFRDVYINAMVRDAEGNKMSKSKGTCGTEIDLVDGIELEPLVVKSLQGLMLESHKEKAEKYIRKTSRRASGLRC